MFYATATTQFGHFVTVETPDALAAATAFDGFALLPHVRHATMGVSASGGHPALPTWVYVAGRGSASALSPAYYTRRTLY